MTDLIERLKAATEGSRELDAEILAVAGTHVLEKRGRDRQEWWYPVEGPEYRRINKYEPPRFTRSIDAAMTLVPESKHSNKAAFIHSAMFQLHIGDIPDERIPLALCIAALSAREAG